MLDKTCKKVFINNKGSVDLKFAFESELTQVQS